MSENDTIQSANFNRPPRIQLPDIERPEVIIPTPPTEREFNDMGLLASILPVMGISVMALFYIIRSATGGGDIFFALPMVFIAIFIILGTLVARNVRQKQHEEQRVRDELRYVRLLAKRQAKLQAANNVQIGTLEHRYPAPDQWLDMAAEHDLRLWERRPQDIDFASMRVGIGRVRARVKIQTPEVDQDSHLLEKALQIADEHRYIERAPITMSLHQQTSLGITGSRNQTLDATRALICSLAVSHSPQDLQIYLISSMANYDDWEWMRWLPHVTKGQQGGAGDFMAFDATKIRTLLGDLSQRLDERKEREDASNIPLILLVVDGAHLIESESIYGTIFRNGADVGAAALCVVKQYASIPSECQAILEIEDDDRFSLMATGQHQMVEGHEVDYVTPLNARYLARSLSGVTISTTGLGGRVPRRVDFRELYDLEDIRDFQAILARTWTRVGKQGRLPFSVPIGRESIADTISITLNEYNDGSHGILAGTTGAGKSELLQTLICALAAEHDPRLLTFLLIDFKGGSSFNMFKDLPHTIGMVTNLNRSLVSRALEALRAEISERQHMLNEKRVSDITEYHETYIRSARDLEREDPLSHLFIVVDEFAQLYKNMPEFVQELVNIAQIGRSLGIHLLLGTQSPMEVITEEINANIQFRICLRVQTIEASRAMLRRPDAAYLPLGWPGRGYFQVGEQGIFRQFQTAYVGADYEPPQEASSKGEEYVLKLLQENGDVLDLLDLEDDEEEPVHTDIYATRAGVVERSTVGTALCDQIIYYANMNDIGKARQLLLPPLEDNIPLATVCDRNKLGGWDGHEWLPTRSDASSQPIAIGSAPIGLVDDIFTRMQEPLWVNFNRISENHPELNDGHLLIVGNPGTGKTTTIRTIALSLAILHAPDDLHMYFLSLTGGGLNELGNLPHAERVVLGTEEERVRRLFRRLDDELTRRQEGGERSEHPVIVLFIDQYEQFAEIYRDSHYDTLTRLVNEGRGVNLFVAMTVSQIRTIPERLRSLIQQRIAFQQTEMTDYLMSVGRLSSEPEQLPNGRGFVHTSPPLMCHVCMPHLSRDKLDNKRTMEALSRAIDDLRQSYGRVMMVDTQKTIMDAGLSQAPATLDVLPTEIKLYELNNARDNADPLNIETVIGKLDNDSLTPFTLDWQQFGPGFVVSGPPGSGKTNLLHAVILAAAQQYSPQELRFVLVDFSNQSLYPLRNLKHVISYKKISGYVTRPLELKAQMANLESELDEIAKRGRSDRNYDVPATVIVIDDYDTTSEAVAYQTTVFDDLRNYLQLYRDAGLYVWTAGYLEKRGDPLMRQLLLKRAGIVMSDRNYLQKLNIRISGLNAQLMPRGRAFIPSSDEISIVQTVLVDDVERQVKIINNTHWEDEQSAQWRYPAEEDDLREQAQSPYTPQPVTTSQEMPAIASDDEGEEPTSSLSASKSKSLINVTGLLDELLGGQKSDDDDDQNNEGD